MHKKASEFLKYTITEPAKIGLILGSGLGILAEEFENPIYLDYSNIPGFPKSTVEGHKGRFVYGEYANKKVLAMQGRFHYYEGIYIKDIVLPIRVMREIGIKTIIITNAAGGINTNYKPGDLMIIEDHINQSGINPLRGANNDEIGPRFPDMSYAYDPALRALAKELGKGLGIDLKSGVYAMMQGPSFETPAEIRMLRTLGADAVGMSTVPEVITAVHAGIKVLGISCISNMAAGILDQALTHDEVIATADMIKDKFISLIFSIISSL